MNLSKSEKIIFSILGVIGIGIVCNKVIYPGFLALKEGQSQNIENDFVQEDFVLPLQEDLQKAGFDDINVSINTFKTDISFENLREYDFDVVISSKKIKEYEDIADDEKKAEELYSIMEKMSNKFENGYSDYTKPIAINEDINDNIDYSNQEKDEVLDNPDVEGPTLGSYTDGYNAIVEDEEYDLDRYQEDSEYRKGVDDAMEELDEYY
ncbi:hypothetical protein [Faecalitalea cylindroides]|uniref:hypothetical protein n=1 Tax=Faecalitalea cylindroides TaxID=39483 RepID=UPI00243161FB|nr:hypothetical protein [Faecalitalea cylindroides]